ncbi:LytR family transcriptional attenuator [Murinocardiopsis flavida]|uniref:LytR family transcriptional attenuator n=1 Tax=Murinocardiopsis flavida TaxID=645275 RepID=A0A2P8DIL8_9ACTN|nr:LCP family protein [Murinocardiopsis flavida]PSK97073.1 LytR family transcriptional attenuator [Murinocardiopsis flavida]
MASRRSRSARSTASQRTPRARREGRLGLGAWAAIATTAAVIAGSLGGYGFYWDLTGNITTEDVEFGEFGDRPGKIEGAMNLMLVGSDVRTGENAKYGAAEGERPDTLVIAHISPGRQGAIMVNLPRDTMLELPACRKVGDKPGYAPHSGMIGDTMSLGGVECLWKTVEKLTGIHIDHFVSVDFGGFKGMVDSLGGVDMCIPKPLQDKKAKLNLKAGEQRLNGEQSLAFVRSRYSQGDGTDLGRIERQQEFMGAMLKKVMSSDILTSPSNLRGFLGAVTDSITVDEELTVDTMMDIAIAMREVDLENIEFVTVPNGAHPADPNRVAWSEPAAGELFKAIAKDADSLPGKGKGDKGDKKGGGGGAKKDDAPAVPPGDVSVEVINGTGTPGLGTQVAELLGGKDFQVAGSGNPQGEVPAETTVYYGEGKKGHAKALADTLENAKVAADPALDSTVRLVMAADWKGLSGDSGGDSGGGGATPDGTTAADAKNAC